MGLMFILGSVLPFLTFSAIYFLPVPVSGRPYDLELPASSYWNEIPAAWNILRHSYINDWKNEALPDEDLYLGYRSINPQLPGDPQDSAKLSYPPPKPATSKLARFNPMRGKRPTDPSPRTEAQQAELRIQSRRFNAMRGKRFLRESLSPDKVESGSLAGRYNLMRGKRLWDLMGSSGLLSDDSEILADRYNLMRGKRLGNSEDAILFDVFENMIPSTGYNLIRGKRFPGEKRISGTEPYLYEREIHLTGYNPMRGKRYPNDYIGTDFLTATDQMEDEINSGSFNAMRGKRNNYAPIHSAYPMQVSGSISSIDTGTFNPMRGKRLIHHDMATLALVDYLKQLDKNEIKSFLQSLRDRREIYENQSGDILRLLLEASSASGDASGRFNPMRGKRREAMLLLNGQSYRDPATTARSQQTPGGLIDDVSSPTSIQRHLTQPHPTLARYIRNLV